MQMKKMCLYQDEDANEENLCQDGVVNANADDFFNLCPDGGANASKESMFVSGWCCVCR